MAAILACQSPSIREMWNGCHKKVADIGIESGMTPFQFRLNLSAQSLASLQEMGLEVAITQELALSDGQERRALVPPFADIHQAFWGHGRIFLMATDDKADGGYLLWAE